MSSLPPIGQPPVQVNGVEPTTSTSPPPVSYMQGTLGGIASMLSLSPSDLQHALKSGSSVADLAAASGVSRSSVAQYIEQQVQAQRSAQGQTPIDPAALSTAVNNALDRHRGGSQAVAGSGGPQAASTRAAEGEEPLLDLFA